MLIIAFTGLGLFQKRLFLHPMNKKLLFFLVLFIGTVFVACKPKQSLEQKLLQGEWKLVIWDNVPTTGNVVFKDSSMFFSMEGGITEAAICSIKNDTIRFRRVGGNTNYVSSGENWIIERLTEDIFRMHSSFGMIVQLQK